MEKSFELPLFESKKLLMKNQSKKKLILRKFFNEINIEKIKLSKNTLHKLSHQNLEIYFWKILAKKNRQKKIIFLELKKKVFDYPFPKPIKIYLNEILS